MKKAFKIFGISLGSILGAILLVMVIFAAIQPLIYSDYYKEAEKEFTAAGLNDGLVPQGFTYVKEGDLFIQCGYMADGESPSRIYVADREGNSRYIELLTESGEPYTGHTGGIAAGNTKIWLANDGDGEDNCVWVMDLAEVLDGNTKEIRLATRFYPENRSACCYVQDGILWVGEFRDPAKYPTKESHRIVTSAGQENNAFVCAYEIDESEEIGIASTLPLMILSVPDRLQGFAVNEKGEFALSTSYSVSNSHIYIHENVTQGEPDTFFEMEGSQIPVWYLDGNSLKKDVEMAPMSEEIVCVDGRLYILCESACHKYIFGILTRGMYVYSIPFS